MKILIAGSVNEYSSHEEEAIVRLLADELKRKGHTVDSFLMPYKPNPLILPDQILAISVLDVSCAELLITVGYPACTLNHSNKIVYLLETAPMLHEYRDTEYGVMTNRQYSDILLTVNNIEKRCFSEAKKVLCSSELLSRDLMDRYGITAQMLPYPVLQPKFTAKADELGEGYFLAECCLLQNSRFLEFAELCKKNSAKRVCVFVPEADPVYLESLKRTVHSLEIEQNFIIYEGQPLDSVIKNALAYLHFPFDSRRADNILKRCIRIGTPIIAAKDSGYGAELSEVYKSVVLTDFSNILSARIPSRIVAAPFGTEEKFAESVMSL